MNSMEHHHRNEMVEAHVNSDESRVLDELQGGERRDPESGLKEYSGLHSIVTHPHSIEHMKRAHYDAGGHEEYHKAWDSVKEAGLGRHGDNEMVLLPRSVANVFDDVIGGPHFNPKTNKREYFSLSGVLSGIGGALSSAKSSMSNAFGRKNDMSALMGSPGLQSLKDLPQQRTIASNPVSAWLGGDHGKLRNAAQIGSAAIGQMGAGLAHDALNPLSSAPGGGITKAISRMAGGAAGWMFGKKAADMGGAIGDSVAHGAGTLYRGMLPKGALDISGVSHDGQTYRLPSNANGTLSVGDYGGVNSGTWNSGGRNEYQNKIGFDALPQGIPDSRPGDFSKQAQDSVRRHQDSVQMKAMDPFGIAQHISVSPQQAASMAVKHYASQAYGGLKGFASNPFGSIKNLFGKGN